MDRFREKAVSAKLRAVHGLNIEARIYTGDTDAPNWGAGMRFCRVLLRFEEDGDVLYCMGERIAELEDSMETASKRLKDTVGTFKNIQENEEDDLKQFLRRQVIFRDAFEDGEICDTIKPSVLEGMIDIVVLESKDKHEALRKTNRLFQTEREQGRTEEPPNKMLAQ